MTPTKKFQDATVETVMEALRAGHLARRFLVADEVGLGKTVIAQHVIKRMMSHRRKPLIVFYMCSNLSIASQNRRKLLEVLPQDERSQAECRVDRLTLLPGTDPPEHRRLHLYTLTPDTSIPMRKSRRRDGRQEERALVHALVERLWPAFFNEWGKKVFRRNAHAYWKYYVRQQQKKAKNVALQQAFKQSVREEFGLEPYQHLLPVIRDLDELSLIAHLRNALAASAIEQIEPDLVIFDEFQKFRDITAPDLEEEEARVVGRLRGDGVVNPPALLMLSATPYRLFSRRWEDEAGSSHRSEFFELIEFLYGGDARASKKRRECEQAFEQLEHELRKGEFGSDDTLAARRRVEDLLRPIMARTERASHPAGREEAHTELLSAEVAGDDLKVFKNLSDSLHERHRSGAVSYWSSIPLPMQSMGNHYEAWKASDPVNGDGFPRLDESMRDQFERPATWPHPRLRALRELIPPQRMAVPWVAPSCPWWPLRGAWRDAASRPRKALVFSRFRAVPQMIAAGMSFDLESEYLSREKLTYAAVTKRRLMPAKEGRQALLALFHPSPLLVRDTDPLRAAGDSIADKKRGMRRQVRDLLAEVGVSVQSSAPRLPLWRVLVRLESASGLWETASRAWWRLNRNVRSRADDDAGLGQLLQDWDAESGKPIEEIHPSTVETLVEYALGAPGVVLGRALIRHWPDAVEHDGFYHTLEASWTALRTYLDQRCFYLALRKGNEKYPETLLRAVLDGNLEAVLDEHLWITQKLRNLSEKALANELRDGLTVKSGLFYLHPLGDKDGDTFSLRCHAAMPFVQTRSSYLPQADDREKPIRTDEMRKAFNTPFWPYVLATTSVGQEGLDFHAWCDTLVHWDLCRNPVDLEQREGRIQRYGGLATRRAVGGTLSADATRQRSQDESPWSAIERLADEQLTDDSGLAPWWVYKGANVHRYAFDVPTSEQTHWLSWMKEQRLLYRLALGQPNQEDLIEVLSRKARAVPDAVRNAVINLSPHFEDRG